MKRYYTRAFVFLTLIAAGANSFSIGRVHAYRAPGAQVTKSRSATLKPIATKSTSLKSAMLTSCLQNVPTWTYYSVFHILGGCTGTPIVVRATKTWYKRIPLPSWTPPNFVFAPVWTLLYGLMGVSVSRIVRAGARDSIALKLWVVHYLLNLLWAPLFFGLQYLRVGLVINFALVSTLLVILNLFRVIDQIAAYLQVPYTPVVNLSDEIK